MAPITQEMREDFGDNVEEATFNQILEMDEDEGDYEFSKSIVFDFLEQAEKVFQQMDDLVKEKDLESLSSQGHFLKGSSATLGFVHIRDACEKIQHHGHKKDETGTGHIDDETALREIKKDISEAKSAYEVIHDLMTDFFQKLVPDG